MEITPLSDFQIAETQTFQKAKTKLDDKLYKKITKPENKACFAFTNSCDRTLGLIIAAEVLPLMKSFSKNYKHCLSTA
jgi:hypothetical protein